MNDAQRRVLQPLLDLIEEIEPDAGGEFRAQVNAMMDEDLAQIIASLPEVDGLAYGWQWSWKKMARAWLLVSMAGGQARMTYEPTPEEMTGYLAEMRHASEAQVRAGILALLTQTDLAQRSISEISAILTDPSRESWAPAQFTDPRQHRRDDYRYIITALRTVVPTIADPQEIAYLEQHRRAYLLRDSTNAARRRFNITQYYLSDPTCLSHEVLSCSVISHRKNKTYQNMSFGFVLHVPKNNVCAAGHQDLVAASVQNTARGQNLAGLSGHKRRVKSNDFLSQMAGKAKRNLPTPAQILELSGVNGHNELIVVGTFMGQVRAKAIFVKVTGRDKLWRSFVEDEATFTTNTQTNISAMIFACAERNGIPIIPIPDDRGEDSDVDFQAWLERRYARPARALVPVEEGRLQAAPAHLSPMQARMTLARLLQASSPFEELKTFQGLYRRMAVTHHPDKTDDEEKIQKFMEVRRLLELLNKPATGNWPTKMIKAPE